MYIFDTWYLCRHKQLWHQMILTPFGSDPNRFWWTVYVIFCQMCLLSILYNNAMPGPQAQLLRAASLKASTTKNVSPLIRARSHLVVVLNPSFFFTSIPLWRYIHIPKLLGTGREPWPVENSKLFQNKQILKWGKHEVIKVNKCSVNVPTTLTTALSFTSGERQNCFFSPPTVFTEFHRRLCP